MKKLTLFLSLMILLALSACEGRKPPKRIIELIEGAPPIKIAVAGPHTGSSAAFGAQFWRGAKKASEDLNKMGGVNGREIQLIRADDACNPEKAKETALSLVKDKRVDAVVGHFCSSSTIPASEIYAEANILMITPGSTNPLVTERNLENILRVCGRDDQQGRIAGNFIIDKLKAKNVAIIYDKDLYGQGLANAVKSQINARGFEEVVYQGINQGLEDFSSVIRKIKTQKADVVYFGGYHTEAGHLLKSLTEAKLTPHFVSGDGIAAEDFIRSAGGIETAAGAYLTFDSDPRKLAESQKVVEYFRAVGYEPEGYALYAYAALQAIVTAMINNDSSNDGVLLTNWLKQQGVKTVIGFKEFDAKGDLIESNYALYQWTKDEEYVEISSKR